MHLALLVVEGKVLLHYARGALVVNHHGAFGAVVHNQLYGVEQFPRVAARYAEQGFHLLHLHLSPLRGVVAHRAVRQLPHLGLAELLQHIDLTTGQQGGYDFERGVLRRGTDEGDDALFHRSQQRVLLALRETVYLVDKQDGILLALGLVNHLAHLLHAAAYGTQRVEGAMQHVADDHGQGGLSDARRAPENHGRDAATLHQCAQHGSRPHKVLLPDVVVQVGGPQYFG